MKTLAVIPAVILSMFTLTTSNMDYTAGPFTSFGEFERPVLIENNIDVPHLRTEADYIETISLDVELTESEINIPFLQAEEELAAADRVMLFETELEVPNLQEEDEISTADLVYGYVDVAETDTIEPEYEEAEEMICD